jgi:hypothetical protein
VGPSTQRLVERFAEASTAFEGALCDRHGLGRLDECYGELCACAAGLLQALLDDPNGSRALPAELRHGLAAYSRGERTIGERPEDDVAFVEHVLAAR